MHQPTHKIRIKDVAERAGVSTGTVDRVLHNRDGVNDETKTLVMSILEEMGYRPNLLARSLASKQELCIVILFPNAQLENPYWKLPLEGVDRAVRELSDYNVRTELISFDAGDENSYIKACQEVVERAPHAVVFNPVFRKTTLSFVKQLEELELPYLFFDINIDGLNNISYFGQNAFESGYAAARLFYYQLNDGDQLLVLNLANNRKVLHHLKQRGEGFNAFFNEHRKVKNIEVHCIDFDLLKEDEMHEGVKSLNYKYPRLKGIFVPSSRVYKVAMQIDNPNWLIVGYDKIEENVKLMQANLIDFLICQKSDEQAYRAIMSMFQFLIGGGLPAKSHPSPIDIIFKENVKYY